MFGEVTALFWLCQFCTNSQGQQESRAAAEVLISSCIRSPKTAFLDVCAQDKLLFLRGAEIEYRQINGSNVVSSQVSECAGGKTLLSLTPHHSHSLPLCYLGWVTSHSLISGTSPGSQQSAVMPSYALLLWVRSDHMFAYCGIFLILLFEFDLFFLYITD